MSRASPVRKSKITVIVASSILVCGVLALAVPFGIAEAQINQRSRGECSPNISGQNNQVNCPVVRHSGQCPPNYIYSRTHGDCIPIQHRGGVIPCSPDDMTFIPGRGWVSNC